MLVATMDSKTVVAMAVKKVGKMAGAMVAEKAVAKAAK